MGELCAICQRIAVGAVRAKAARRGQARDSRFHLFHLLNREMGRRRYARNFGWEARRWQQPFRRRRNPSAPTVQDTTRSWRQRRYERYCSGSPLGENYKCASIYQAENKVKKDDFAPRQCLLGNCQMVPERVPAPRQRGSLLRGVVHR